MPAPIEVGGRFGDSLSAGDQAHGLVDQLLLIGLQRSNVDGQWTATDDDEFWGLSTGTLRTKSLQAYSTVTDFAKFRGLSTSVPRAHAVWYASNCSGTTCRMGESRP